MTRLHRALLPALLAILQLLPVARAQPPARAELGLRATTLAAEVPVLGIGLAGRLPLRDGWFVDVALERQRYADRRALHGRGLASTVAGAAIGRHFAGDDRGSWFWSWGIAAGLPAAAGPGAGPGRDTAATEIHLAGAVGLSRPLSRHWTVTAALRAERRFVDWRRHSDDGRIVDRRGELGLVGLGITLGYRL